MQLSQTRYLLFLYFTLLLSSIQVFAQDIELPIYKDTIRHVDFQDSLVLTADFHSTYFSGNANFGALHFRSNALFRNAYFESGAFFLRTKFDSWADFAGAYFGDGITTFFRTEFDSIANFKEVNFDSELEFKDARFYSVASFYGANFNSATYFDAANFHTCAGFGEASFNSLASFPNVEFHSSTDFSNTEFDTVAHFNHIKSYSDIFFDNSEFRGWANFQNSRFDSTLFFRNAKFIGMGNFRGASFNSGTTFGDTQFCSSVDFNSAKFSSMVDFKKTYLGRTASFIAAEFKGNVRLDSCYLPNTLFFSGVKTEEEIDFTYALLDSVSLYSVSYALLDSVYSDFEFLSFLLEYFLNIPPEKRCEIDLYGTDINKLKFDYSRFKVFRNIQEGDNLYSRRQLSNVYEQILKMQKEKGFIDGYEVADKEYRHFALTYEKSGLPLFLGIVGSKIQDYWWDYGYSKSRILIWVLLSLILFTYINARNFSYMIGEVYKIDNIYEAWKSRNDMPVSYAIQDFEIVPNYNPIHKHNLLYASFYTLLIFFGLRLNIDKINFQHRSGAIFLLIQYGWGLVCLAYLANFIILS